MLNIWFPFFLKMTRTHYLEHFPLHPSCKNYFHCPVIYLAQVNAKYNLLAGIVGTIPFQNQLSFIGTFEQGFNLLTQKVIDCYRDICLQGILNIDRNLSCKRIGVTSELIQLILDLQNWYFTCCRFDK